MSTPPKPIQYTFAQQPRTTFQQNESAPLAERTQLRYFKCKRLGHTKPMFKFSNNRPTTMSTSDQQHRDRNRRIRINATTGEFLTVLLGPVGQPKRRFLVDSGAEINLLKRK
ncbi:uncharacterized protein [Bombus fervidus]|uniref:uncharacterized protein n=1 Tax=Bombus fervidus TaxID=203811 RepID=UPI003D18B7B1